MNPENNVPNVPLLGNGEASLVPAKRALNPLAIIANIAANTTNDAIIREASMISLQENMRVLITKSVLDNTAVLSELENHYSHVCPLGSARYAALVDAYVIGAVTRIRRL